MKRVFTGVVLSLVTASAVGGFAKSESQPVAMTTTQSAPVTATRKGVIKTISDTAVVMVPADDKHQEVTYHLTPATKRTGTLAAGEPVVVTYYYDSGQPVVTAVTGKASGK